MPPFEMFNALLSLTQRREMYQEFERIIKAERYILKRVEMAKIETGDSCVLMDETAKLGGRSGSRALHRDISQAHANCPFSPPKRAPPLIIFIGPNPYWVPYLICYKTPLHNKNPTPSSILLPSDNNTSTTLDPSLVHYNYILLILFQP